MNAIDRRAFLRVRAELRVRWQRLSPRGRPMGRWIAGVTTDVSAADLRMADRRVRRWSYAQGRRAAERRASLRVPLQLMVSCRELPSAGPPRPMFRAATVDLAADGARIFTERPLELNSRLRVDLAVGDPPVPMTVDGRVVWRRPEPGERWSVGIHLDRLDRDAQQMLADRAFAHERRLHEAPQRAGDA